MKNFISKLKWFVLGGLVLTAGTILAVQVSVPSAPTSGYDLTSTSTGNYISTSTSPRYFGSIVATTTNATSTFMGNVLISPVSTGANYGFQSWQALNIVGNTSNPWQDILVNQSAGAQALACRFVGNDKIVNNGFSSQFYGGTCIASSGYNTPGANAVRPNGVATFASDGPYSFGSAATTAASSTVFIQAGQGLDISYDGAFMGGTGDFVIGTTSLISAGGFANYALLGAYANAKLWVSSSTIPQLALEGANTDNIWNFRGIGNNLYVATSSPTTFATSTASALRIDPNGNLNVDSLSLNSGSAVYSLTGTGLTITSGALTVALTNGTGINCSGNSCSIAAPVSIANGGTNNTSAAASSTVLWATNTLYTGQANMEFDGSHFALGTTTSAASIQPAYLDIASSTGNQLALLDGNPSGNTDAGWVFRNSGQTLYIGTSSPTTLATTTTSVLTIDKNGNLGISTSTPQWKLTIASTTMPQLGLIGANADNVWTMRSIGNWFYIATSSPTTYATSTVPALTIDPHGKTGIASSTPFGLLSLDVQAFDTNPVFVIGSSTKTLFQINPTYATSTILSGTTTVLDANTAMTVSAGQGTGTTTINFGEIGKTGAATCFNVMTNTGAVNSFWFRAGTQIVEQNACR